jgi:DNA-binding LacI/PurR family transcriptional regulator
MDDVAALAGVSRGTVSRALNGGHHVSPAARAAIRKAVRKTGYVVNQHARSLATQRSRSVAFILSESPDVFVEDPNYNVLLGGCVQALAARDMTLLLTTAGTAEDSKLDELNTRGVPVVACGKPLGPERDISYVAIDDRDGARRMVRHLRARGRHRIATITGPLDLPGGVDRLAGYYEVLGQTDSRLVATGDYTQASGEAAMERLLREVPNLDAVFVASDLMAAGALATLSRAGRRVPDDVAVGGFDDSKVATATSPKLTTIRQPWARQSVEMVRLLLRLIDGEQSAAVVLPGELVVRDST